MKTWKVSSRLKFLSGMAALVMVILITVNWISLSHLGQLQDSSYKRTQEASQIRHDASLGAQAYRVVADTFLNREFDAVARKWQVVSGEIDTALEFASKAADTEQERESAQNARQAATEFRKLYTEVYLPMAKRDASRSEISGVDDQIDKLIDKYDENMSKSSVSLQADATRADEAYDTAVRTIRVLNVVCVLIGGMLLVGLALVVAHSITSQLGMELNEAMAWTQSIAAGDLSTKGMLSSYVHDSLAASLAAMVDTLASIVSKVREGSDSVATASAEIAQGNQDLSSRTESQASSLEQTSASMEELGSTVKQNADSAHHANQLANSASVIAVEGGAVVAQVVETMKGINEASRKISDIIGVIDGIAFQTNILALNAAVEAARAGEQGRGFAVVASEVRSLAGRSADAAKEIKHLISASVERVGHGTTLVDQAGVTMSEVVTSIKRVTDIMNEISAASNEQSAGVAQVGEAVVQMDRATQQNAALVEEMAAAAGSLKTQAQELVQTVAVFNLGQGRESAVMRRLPPKFNVAAAKKPSLQHVAAIKRPTLQKAGPSVRPKAIGKPKPPSLAAPTTTTTTTAATKDSNDEWETF